MAVIRVNKTADYTVMSNAHFREKGMSLKAKGLLSLMLSLPDSWDYSIAGLTTLSTDGKDSVMSGLNELEQFGYLIRTRTFDEKGRFAGYDYDIFENPQTEKPYAENPNTVDPQTEKPYSENPQQLNTNLLSNNILSTKKESTNYKAIIDCYNDTCVSLQSVKALSDSRKKAIKARLNTYSFEDIKTVFEKAEASDFLKGKNDRNWQANFDWLMKDSNFAKVLDGNYDNKPKNGGKNNAGNNEFGGFNFGQFQV